MRNDLRKWIAMSLAILMAFSCTPVSALAEAVVRTSEAFSLLSTQVDLSTTHTFIFMQEGTETARQIVLDGETLNAPATPEKEGHKFLGWSESPAGGAPYQSFGAISVPSGEDLTTTLYADFAQAYYVFFLDVNGRVIETREGTAGQTIVADATFPVGAEETITGWYTDEGLTQRVTSVTLTDSNIVLYAKIENGYWVTYDTGRDADYFEPAFVVPGGKAPNPGVPARPGYTFLRWSTTANGTGYNFNTVLTANLTLHAVWSAVNVHYTVVHWQEYADWENPYLTTNPLTERYYFKEAETKNGTTGNNTNATAKSYTGFTAVTPIEQETIAGDGSTIVNVYYNRNTYMVRFYERRSNRWNEIPDYRITAKYEANISSQWPDDTNFRWSVTQSTSNGPWQNGIDIMPLNGKSFYQQEQSGSYTYHTHYQVQSLENPGQYTTHHTDTILRRGDTSFSEEDFYEIPGFTYTNNIDTGASYQRSGTKINGQNAWNIYLLYSRNSYDLVFMNNGVQDRRETLKFEQSLVGLDYVPDRPAGMSEDYSFEGWYDNQLCVGEPFSFSGTMPSNNVSLYANWVIPTRIVVAYVNVEGTQAVSGWSQRVVLHGDIISEADLPSPSEIVPAGYEWHGWCTRSGSEGNYTYHPYSFSSRVVSDITLYPYYTSAQYFSVSYSSGDGLGTVPTDAKKYAQDSYADVQSATDVIAPEGKVFVYWQDGNGTVYYPGSKVRIPAHDVVLTAQFDNVPITVTLTYHKNDGTFATFTTESMSNNQKVVTLSPGNLGWSRPSYHFLGWAIGEGGAVVQPGALVQVSGSTGNDLYAIWEKSTYIVSYQYIGMIPTDAPATPLDAEYSEGDTVSVAEKPALSGYVFEGWQKEGEPVGASFTMPAEDVVLHGSWSLEDYHITYEWTNAPLMLDPPTDENVYHIGDSYTVDEEYASGHSFNQYDSFGNIEQQWIFSGWSDPNNGVMPAADVVITGTWTHVTHDVTATYQVEHYLQNLPGSGSEWTLADTDTALVGTIGDTASVTAKTYSGYSYDPSRTDSSNTIAEGKLTIKADGSLVVRLYYVRQSVSYTIHHYWLGIDTPVSDDETGTVLYGSTVTAQAKTGENLVFDSFAPAGSMVIAANPDDNVITVYYKSLLTLTAGTASQVYNGQALTEEDFTVTGLINHDEKADFAVTMTADSMITHVGTHPNTINGALTQYQGGTIPVYYVVHYVAGELEITARPITISANNATHLYDGTPKTVISAETGKAYAGDSLVAGHQINTTVVYGPEQDESKTYIGTYTAKVVQNATVIMDGTENVTSDYAITYADGLLAITGVDITPYKQALEAPVGGYRLGDEIQFIITVNNNTNANLQNVIVTETTDAVIVNGTGYSVSADQKSATITVIPANGGQGTVQAKHIVTEADILAGRYVNTATVTANNADYPVSTTVEAITAGVSQVAVKKTVTSMPGNGTAYALGETIAYEIKVVNEGNLTLTDVRLNDELPGFTYTEGSAEVGTLLPGESATVKGQYIVTENDLGTKGSLGAVENSVQVSATGSDDAEVEAGDAVSVSTNAILTIKANDNTVVYDSAVHGENTEDPYTVDADELLSGHTVSSVTIAGGQKNVGEYTGELEPTAVVIVDGTNTDVTNLYEVIFEKGDLKITPASLLLQIVAHDQNGFYDGNPYPLNKSFGEGYAIMGEKGTDKVSLDTVKLTVIDHEGTPISEAVHAGVYDIGFEDAAGIRLYDDMLVDVTQNYDIHTEVGKLTIAKRPLTITALNQRFDYDNMPHGPSGATLTGEALAQVTVEAYDETTGRGLIAGDSLQSVILNGSQTDEGIYPNELIPENAVFVHGERDTNAYKPEGWDANYEVTYIAGTLTIRPTTTLMVDKTWYDDNNNYHTRPETITFQLMANGEVVATNITSADDNWETKFEYVPVLDDNDERIIYTVKEAWVPGYISVVNQYQPNEENLFAAVLDVHAVNYLGKFPLIIHYIYEDGTVAFPTVQREVLYGDFYLIESPKLQGFTASCEVARGNMPPMECVWTIIYTPNDEMDIDDLIAPLPGSIPMQMGECFD